MLIKRGDVQIITIVDLDEEQTNVLDQMTDEVKNKVAAEVNKVVPARPEQKE